MRWLTLWCVPIVGVAGSFPGDDAIESSSVSIWAVGGDVVPGPVDITVPEGALASYGTKDDVTGPSDAGDDVQLGVVSLGDGGSATIRFASPVSDGAGPDLAVFENGFSGNFLELAHVEVSSNGQDFVRFPSVSETQTGSQIGAFSFGLIDPTEIHNLAGKYEAGFGTPFDLAELRGRSALLDVSHITHVRIIDVVGSIDPAFGTRDSTGQLINDPFKTNFSTGGFDLDAVGALHQGHTELTSWRDYHFPDTTGSGNHDDADGDGIANLIEYALASDPTSTNPQPLAVVHESGVTVLKWNRSMDRTGVTLSLQGSNTLSTWTTLTVSVDGSKTMPQAAGVSVTEASESSLVTTTVPSSFTFFRFRAD